MPWTEIMDMHSFGYAKLFLWANGEIGTARLYPAQNPPEVKKIFVEMREPEARAWFMEKFGRDPDNVTCSCCGPDYSISEASLTEQGLPTVWNEDLRDCEFGTRVVLAFDSSGNRVPWPFLDAVPRGMFERWHDQAEAEAYRMKNSEKDGKIEGNE